jgi:uncharacterized protein (DUF1684 family)
VELERAKAEAESERTAREAHYLGPDTPLSAEARAAFRGLSWWPYDARYRVRARFERHAQPRKADLAATGDDAIAMLEVGAFAFTLLGQPCRLLAFAPAPGEADEDYVLVPFRDATSGKESYGGGRYLDLDPPAGDEAALDFNRAYHPYCAHDDAWSCTLPPPQNRLTVRVEAGERL